ncbi:hypothetical protein [Catenulispora rubra]|uniref:hypothetical protein n=1 Tax=Catenulispora rubra TaxID=280293 RepID=UPI0018923462|nr:hypothetical protein [Catenulispora rubra]
MFLKNTESVAAYPRTPRWWAVPLVATIAILVISVASLVTAEGRNSRQGMGGIAVYFLVLLSFFALCGMWASAAFPAGKASRPDRVPPAVFGFLLLTAVFLVGATRIAFV